MARMRTIKPEFFTSETLALVDIPVRLTFAGLWCYVDDEGYARANPDLVKAAVWPLDKTITSDDVVEHLDLLEHKCHVICRYQFEGRAYLHVTNFHEHQHPNRSTPSKLPPCPDHPPHDERSRQPQGERMEPSVSAQGHGSAPRTEPRGEDEDPYKDRPEIDRLCQYLVKWVDQNGNKKPRVTKKWRETVRLMIDVDKRSVDEIRAVIEWSQKNDFWKPHILAMPKLRDKYDTLRSQREVELAKTNGHHTGRGHASFTNPSDDRLYAEEDL